VLSNEKNVYEELGTGFTLIALDADDASVAAIVAGAASVEVPLSVVRDSFADDRIEFAARLVLVRPDQFVVWAGDRAPDDAKAMFVRVAGAGEPH
jgi:hypothetical protein